MFEGMQVILDYADEKILSRGEKYYESGKIAAISYSSDGIFTAQVCGSQGELYYVTITTGKSGKLEAFSCNCPYDFGNICKHIVAVAVAILNGEFEKSDSKKAIKPDNDINRIIENLDTDILKEFVVQYSSIDTAFKTELLANFGTPEDNVELSRIKEQIRNIIRSATHRGYIDYRGCDFICEELDNLTEFAQKRIARGRATLGFSIALHIMLTGVKLASTADSSSGSLTMTIDTALTAIDTACATIADYGTPSEKKTVYEKCIKEAKNKVFDGWGEWNYIMLRSCARFVTDKNVQKIYSALDYLLQVYSSRSIYSQTDDKLTRLNIIHYLEGEEAEKLFISQNLDIDKIRSIAVETALSSDDYSTAQQLCIERINREPNENGVYVRQSEWQAKLLKIYEMSNNTSGQIEIAESLLMTTGSIEYYDKLKAVYTQCGIWDQEYHLLHYRCSQKLGYHIYMQILKKENELELLFEQVKQHSEYSIFEYGKLLSEKFPFEIYAIMVTVIKSKMKSTTDRKAYSKACANIKMLFEIGGKAEAAGLIEELRQSYRQRSALLDELSKLEKKLLKQ